MDIVTIQILINGTEIPGTFNLLSVEVNNAIGTIPSASFVLLLPQGSPGDATFAPSASQDFLPGNKVEIKAGYDGTEDTIFKGMIIRHGIKSGGDGASQLILHCQDEAVRMTVGKQVRAFADQTDGDVLGTIIDEYGLEKDVDPTTYQHPQLLQAGSTDWDFAAIRAETNGLLLYAEDGTVCIKKPLASGDAKPLVTYGDDAYSFEMEMDAGYQLPTVSTAGWDFKTEQFVEATADEPALKQQGNLPGKKLAEVIGKDEATTLSTPLEAAELNAMANGLLLRSRLASLRGRVTFSGNASPRLNTLIGLAGFGERFNGSALVSSIRHTIRAGTWETETGFGLSADLHHEKHAGTAGGNGRSPSVSGLQNGVVKQLDADPDGEHRILVTLPTLGTDVWARQSGLYATRGKGSFFLPEVGDEVIVGFLEDDPRFAVVLGSVYSSKNAPPYTADRENSIKAFVSKNELKIELDDKDKILTVSTPGGNTVVLSDKDKYIVLTDEHGNAVEMNSGGITLKSAKDITLDAKGAIELKARQRIDVATSGGDLNLKGLNVNGKGQVGVKLQGGAAAELSAGGQTVVKGAMVMIN